MTTTNNNSDYRNAIRRHREAITLGNTQAARYARSVAESLASRPAAATATGMRPAAASQPKAR